MKMCDRENMKEDTTLTATTFSITTIGIPIKCPMNVVLSVGI
jgi:hypothetical protein